MKKSISQKLKKSKKFSFRNSPFTTQFSSNGTNSKDIRSRVSEMFYQQPKHARLVSCQCDATVLTTTVWRKPFSKEMAFWWYLKQNWTTHVKFKIYCKYGNARFEHKSGLSLWVTLHSQPPRNRTCAFWNYFEEHWKIRLWNSRYIVRKCMIWERMWIFRGSVGQFSVLSRVGHSWSN